MNSLIKQSLGGDTVLQCQVNANPMGIIVWTFGKDKTPINASSCSILTNKAVKYCVGGFILLNTTEILYRKQVI